jgi:hypothetical protein
MAISRAAATKNLALDAEYDRGTGMLLKIYSGTVPATADTALGAQVLLATLTLANTPFGAASAGVKTAGAIASDTNAANTGTAAFFRLTTSGGTVVAQGTVGTSGTDAIINTTAISAGATVACSALAFTAGA